MDAAGRARITDFGLATVTQNLDSIRSASGDHGHTARWTAPEILNEEGSYSKEADIFSFAMVAIEVSQNGRVELRLTAISYRRRYSPEQFRLTMVYQQRRCWQ